MSSWLSSAASGASETLKAPDVVAGQTLYSSCCGYSVLEFIGEGAFGKVAKCLNLTSRETVAVKIMKKDIEFIQDIDDEVTMLNMISVLDSDHCNVVKFFEQFDHMGQTCLAFEMLDCSLYDLLEERDWRPLCLHEIQAVAQQLLVALDALRGLRILHTDIKPDNVMFVNRQDRPFSVKLIDFGAAIPASEVEPGMMIQPTGYRAPEVSLGLPFTESVDVWGVGCILAFLYLAENLFPVDCDYQMIKCMVQVVGQPEDHVLSAAQYTPCFFIEEEAGESTTWRLMTPEEFTTASSMKPEERNSFIELPGSLDDLVNIYPEGKAADSEDRRIFIDMLKGLLHLDGDQRSSPCQALQHSFFTRSHPQEI
ncbi:homeodomain-interacting protein kinase 1-like [Solea senegalensis]|uniref:Homeodomain-interacting protein kinase 1-like n=1 Tax=Solea senegalensis TaxID=28829 RepID=A0AAV6SW05_SOLSE|nr:homeodomain-interacting protein kinase 1-like [Solea senegalensis]